MDKEILAVEKNEEVEDKSKWYSLRVISGKERLVEDNIAYESQMNDITKFIKEVFVPFEKVVAMRNNKKIIKDKMFFPGYILINMEMTAQSRYIIEKY